MEDGHTAEHVYGHAMDVERNNLGQLVGALVETDLPVEVPPTSVMSGSYCSVVPLDVDAHRSALFAAFAAAPDDREWTYLPYGPFADEPQFAVWIERCRGSIDPMFWAIVDDDGACGIASFLRITPSAASIEVGHIHFAPRLARTRAATEAMYLMMRTVFDTGYRRYEWKCDGLNLPSRQAAQRLGFSFEGIFRQATVVKGRNRDTAWFSIIDSEWPAVQAEFERWLATENFDDAGCQLSPLRMSQ
jgi:RimJ/RimL family protein N-acetyltransferase